MKKTRICYYYFICLSILFAILFVSVFIRIHSGFEYPTQEELRNSLLAWHHPLLVGLIISTSITIALRCLIDDLEWR